MYATFGCIYWCPSAGSVIQRMFPLSFFEDIVGWKVCIVDWVNSADKVVILSFCDRSLSRQYVNITVGYYASFESHRSLDLSSCYILKSDGKWCFCGMCLCGMPVSVRVCPNGALHVLLLFLLLY